MALLIQSGASQSLISSNNNNVTALIIAAHAGHVATVRQLLDATNAYSHGTYNETAVQNVQEQTALRIAFEEMKRLVTIDPAATASHAAIIKLLGEAQLRRWLAKHNMVQLTPPIDFALRSR